MSLWKIFLFFCFLHWQDLLMATLRCHLLVKVGAKKEFQGEISISSWGPKFLLAPTTVYVPAHLNFGT